ncbi:hypothetical protein [Streptomyces cupreus]|uniref:Integral membrane protein n=1 Tax=Streptomyces cupreus TaxID=2759956 RepID=A0A7X1J852_9ACTN|nr:hypothetical protein [Streptomyces cupreus]MBC2904922.1 hypothetical protein [Streptomyces cupreus]
MSGLGGLDRPGTSTSPGARDARSNESLVTETDGPDPGEPGSAPATERRARRPAVDPVKTLMHRHRELCERAVDPLEIAAGLEAHGVTDRTAARFRHRDVFSLAEEMYARVPRDGDAPARTTPPSAPRVRADWAVLALLPGTLCAAAVTALRHAEGQARLIIAVVGVLAVAVVLRVALSRGPLRVADRAQRPTAAWTCGLIAYAALGDGLLRAALADGPDALPTGSPDGAWPLAAAGVLALALSCAPAAWCAHLFTARARRRLAASRGLEEYATSVQPLLLGTFALFLASLAALTALSGAALDETAAHPQVLTLGALLLLARLLGAHGFTHAPAAVLGAAATAEAVALASVFAARLPGCGFLATPVEALVTAWGPGAVPTLVCGTGALTLLIHSSRTLTRASAHATPDAPC